MRLRKDLSILQSSFRYFPVNNVHHSPGVGSNLQVMGTIRQLRDEGYKGFFVAVGLQDGGRLDVPGGDAVGVMSGVDYIKAVNVLDKAGAYAIQEHGEDIIESIDGSLTNVIGLPVERLKETVEYLLKLA